LDGESGSMFPVGSAPDKPYMAARLSWCYGDIGIACALLYAARCVQNMVWEKEALAIGRRAALRSFEDSGVQDATICHGAAGVLHMFNRLFQATGEDVFKDAARKWLQRTLNLRQPGIGVAGYRTLVVDEQQNAYWESMSGLLLGAAGIGLAMLATIARREPLWDRPMLISVPPVLRKELG
jgi:lantibiotic modifying enzyme